MTALVRGRTLALVATAALAAAVATAVHLAAPSPRGTVALLGAVPAAGSPVRLDRVSLHGGTATQTLTPGRIDLHRAPDPTDLGVFSVPAGHYTSIEVRSGRLDVVVPLAVDVPAGSLVPLLVVVDGTRTSAYAGNDHVNLGLLLAGGQAIALPEVTLVDDQGATVPLSSLRGRVTVLASFTTHCHETCPLVTAVLADLRRVLEARGWAQRVAVVEVTMDPDRDTPSTLAAYARLTGASWPLLTGEPAQLARLWSALHARYAKVPFPGPAPVDWVTGGPESYDVTHDTVVAIVDANGVARFLVAGAPRLDRPLPPPLARLVDPDVEAQLGSTGAGWSVSDLLDRLDVILGEPPEVARAPEAALRPGAPAPHFTLRGLDGATVSLGDQLGRPVIVNFWATWCSPCRAELPRLADAARRHQRLHVLAVDEEDGSGAATFLHTVLGSAIPLTVVVDPQGSVAADYHVVGLPVTVFVDVGGTVRGVHVGELDEASLQAGLAAIEGHAG